MSQARSTVKQALIDHRGAYGLGVLALFTTSLTEVLAPKFSQWCIDLVSGSDAVPRVPDFFIAATKSQTLDQLMFGLIGVLLLAVVGRWGWRQSMARRTHEAGLELKLRLWDSLRFQPMTLFQRHTLGDLMSRGTADWNASRNIFGFTMVLTYDLIFFTTLSVGLMFSIDPVIAMVTLVVWPLLPPFILRLARREKKCHIRAQEELAQLSDLISQSVASMRLLKATASERTWLTRMSDSAAEYSRRRVEVLRTGWKIFPLSALPTLFAYGILFWLGLQRLQSGILTAGEFVALCSYVLLLQGPLFELGNHISEWQRGLASLDRLLEIFKLKSDFRSQGENDLVAQNQPLLQIRGLNFSYKARRRDGVVESNLISVVKMGVTLQDVHLQIQKGQIIGVVGPIGSGKSTLAQLICGMIEPPPGTIYLFGQDVTTLPHAAWVSHISMVPQRAFLFAGSIRHNLTLEGTYSDEQLWQVLDLVQLQSDIETMTRGLDSVIGEWGVSLSGGQKQRLALARALLRPRDLFLFDDCLSAVDAKTEELILGALGTYLSGRSCLWVAHRASTLKICTAVYEMKNGRLQLLQKEPTAMTQSAFGKVDPVIKREVPAWR